MLLNNRDREVLGFIEKCPTNSIIIQDLLFPSLQTAQRRLNKLYEAKFVKRYRSHISDNYIYYIDDKPKQIEHTLYLSRLYAHWIKIGYRVLKFKREVVLEKIRADAIAVIKINNRIVTYLVEVEISNNPIAKKIKAYEEFYKIGCMEMLGCRPNILFVTNKKIPHTELEYEVVQLDQLQN